MIKARIGEKAPLLSLSDWVQGEPTNFDQLTGKVVLVEVFQVNCPGCFLYALPQAIEFHIRYAHKGLVVLGVATAFEDFDLNTLVNLRKLVTNGEVIGETLRLLSQQGALQDWRLPYQIPFPLAMDELTKRDAEVDGAEISAFIEEHIPDFNQKAQAYQDTISQQVRAYLQKLEFRAQTFEMYNLKGTPSHILVDKNGILKECAFGHHPELEQKIQELLLE